MWLLISDIKDITDESGYIEAIGRKAASEAVQQAEIDVAEQVRKGAIGVAEADKEKRIQVADREKVRDIGTKTAERERAVRLAELDKEREIGEQRAQFEQESIVRDAEREMRVNVVVRTRDNGPGSNNGATIQTGMQAMENRVFVAVPNDGFLRRVHTTTVRLRNVGFRGRMGKKVGV